MPGGRELPSGLISEIAEELNVREVLPLDQAGEVIDVTVKPNFRALGKRFGSQTQQAASAINDGDQAELARSLKADGHALVDVAGDQAAVTSDEVIIAEVPRSGWAVSTQQNLTVALDTTITDHLRKAGLSREVVRLVQSARKDAGLDVTDRIALSWAASGEMADALREHRQELADAVLAVEVSEYVEADLPDAPSAEAAEGEDTDLGVRFRVTKARQLDKA